MKGWLIYFGAALFSLSLETTFFRDLPGGGWRGPVSFLLVVQAAYQMRWSAGLLLAIACGFLTEAFGAPAIGALPICYGLTFLIVWVAKERIFIETPLTWALWAGLFSIGAQIVWSLWPTVPLQGAMLLPRAVYYAALALALRPAFVWLGFKATGQGEELL